MHDPGPSLCQVRIEIAAALDLVPIVRVAAQVLSATLAADGTLLERVELPLVEAVTNAVVHANHSDPTLPVVVELGSDQDRLVVRISDRGAPFELAEFPPGEIPDLESDHGRGVFLMRQMCDGVAVERLADGNCVILWWRLRRA